MSGFVTFVAGGRELAAPIEQVREVVRADGVEPLRGCVPPVSALLMVHGAPCAIVDLRSPGEGIGDVLVLSRGDSAVGIAVDRVVAVVPVDQLPRQRGPAPIGLPGYITEVRRSGDDLPVFVVDLLGLAGLLDDDAVRVPGFR